MWAMFVPVALGVPTWGWYEADAVVKVYDSSGAFLKRYDGRGQSKLLANWYAFEHVLPNARPVAQVQAYGDAVNKFIADLANGAFPFKPSAPPEPHRIYDHASGLTE